MQFYALDKEGKPLTANRARKQHDYVCIECGSRVRLRGGIHRKSHFYHLDPNRVCRLQQKGIAHLEVQDFLYRLLPSNDCRLEYRFPAINRIADVAWLSQKIIFEVQCSPITGDEVLQRNQDYQSQGWTVVWILHDQRYNQIILSPAERALADHPHYFTNIKSNGSGMIYDQFRLIKKGVCLHKLESLPVDLSQLLKIWEKGKSTLDAVNKRMTQWPYHFGGDLIAIGESDYLTRARRLEEEHRKREEKLKRWRWLRWLRGGVNGLVHHPYRVFFRYMLEKACR